MLSGGRIGPQHPYSKRPHTITKMNYNINMDNTITVSVNVPRINVYQFVRIKYK
jgi:hypothetical protein